jgi:hypothetical protein
MSYIRAGWPMKYVKGISKDYVFPDTSGYIEDYDRITDDGLVELICLYWRTDDELFKNHVMKRLADRLGVKLRKKPLDDEKVMEYFNKQSNLLHVKINYKNKKPTIYLIDKLKKIQNEKSIPVKDFKKRYGLNNITKM